MIEFLAGLALGTAFAPFWMTVWTTFIKPYFDRLIKK